MEKTKGRFQHQFALRRLQISKQKLKEAETLCVLMEELSRADGKFTACEPFELPSGLI